MLRARSTSGSLSQLALPVAVPRLAIVSDGQVVAMLVADVARPSSSLAVAPAVASRRGRGGVVVDSFGGAWEFGSGWRFLRKGSSNGCVMVCKLCATCTGGLLRILGGLNEQDAEVNKHQVNPGSPIPYCFPEALEFDVE